jgi:hypothetical protein
MVFLEFAAALKFIRDGEPDESAAQGGFSPSSVDSGGLFPKAFFGALASSLGAGSIDFLGALRLVSEHDNMIGPHLQEAAGNGENFFLATFAHHQLAGLERSHQGGVVWENTKLPLNAGGDDGIHLRRIDNSFSGDDINLKGRH